MKGAILCPRSTDRRIIRQGHLSVNLVEMERGLKRDRTALVAYALIGGLLLLIAYPVFIWLVKSWLSNPYYSHGFLIPVLSGLIAWRQWRWFSAEPRRGDAWPGLVLSIASLGVTVWAMRWQNYVVASLALIGLLVGILLFLEGWPRLKHELFPLLFLAFAVPLPFVDRTSPWLESFTAHSATALARLVGIEAVQQGGEIALPNTTIVVGAPCSGLRSLVAMITVAVAWIYLVRGKGQARAAMLVAVVPLVALSNVLRVAILLVVAVTLGEEAALTYYHDWSSPILFLMALGLILLLGKLLGCSQIRDDIF
jgi:exosortase